MKPKLIILVGASCTGKTKWAQQLCASRQNIIRVAREELCLMLKGTTFVLPETQLHVDRMYETGIISALSEGIDVIADSYNTSYPALKYYASIYGEHADLYIKVFRGNINDILTRLQERFRRGGNVIAKQQIEEQIRELEYLTILLGQDMGPFTDYDSINAYNPKFTI